MNADEVIPQLERDFVEWGAEAAIVALSVQLPFLQVPFVRAFSKWGAGLVIGGLVEKFDVAAYFLFKSSVNNSDAVAYQDSLQDLKSALEREDPHAISEALAEKNRRFDSLARFNG